ncbi:helix-turn-helix transcriptional regulator [Bradyrhizobium sp.]|uniref:helix-turn-helix transcriptional regulator n=1 Tax=Bradyrhizobium sp. TaxID=376 RepID=UPI003C7724E7
MESWNPDLIDKAFAEAALDSNLWVKALDIVSSITESEGAILIPSSGDALPNIPFTESMSAATESYFRNDWYLRDERTRGLDTMVRRGVVDDLDISNIDRIKRHPYYQEFLAPHGLRWFAGVRVASGEDLWCLSIQRTIEQGPFSEAEKRQFAELSNRLSASAALARALGAATAAGALQAFEASGKAVVLFNRHGEAYRLNKSAEELLRGDVRIEGRKLAARDLSASAALDRALHELMWQRIGGGLLPPIPLPRRGKRPILAYPIKLNSLAANALADCQALVILVDVEKQPRPSETELRTTFNMTAAEARLAGRLAAGESLEFATEQIGISKETGRNQLKSIFLKAGVKRQSELVAVLSSFLVRGKVE